MEGELEARMSGQAFEQRPVTVRERRLEDRGEIPDRLMVVDGEQKIHG
jgi:hypothetical protein